MNPASSANYQHLFQENPKTLHHMDMDMDLNDEADDVDTISLCDLQIYSDAATSQESSYDDNEISSSSSSSSPSLDRDLFEFFSFDSNIPSHDIIFCGKLIPSKKYPVSPVRFSPTRVNSRNDRAKPIKTSSRGLFRWNSDMSNFYKCPNSNLAAAPPRSKSVPVPGKYGGKNDIVPKRASIFQSPTKSRWYLFLFGAFPTKMELSDIRSRQVRRSRSTMFRVEGGDGAEQLGGSGRMGLIRALGCGSGIQTNTVETASVGCFRGI